MKNTVRIHHKSGTNGKTPQLKTALHKPAAKGSALRKADFIPTIGICAKEVRGGRARIKCLMSDIGITVKEWEQAARASIHMKNSGQGDFFAQAIREKLIAIAGGSRTYQPGPTFHIAHCFNCARGVN